jgi:hypothetical protein
MKKEVAAVSAVPTTQPRHLDRSKTIKTLPKNRKNFYIFFTNRKAIAECGFRIAECCDTYHPIPQSEIHIPQSKRLIVNVLDKIEAYHAKIDRFLHSQKRK